MVKDPRTTTTLDRCIADVCRWMEACESNHECLPRTSSPLPKRVIEVGSTAAPIVRLIELDPERYLDRYACLSHCWGKSRPPCLTTKKTLTRNMHGIDWELLPPTFRDAIDFTRQLGLRFLWIDSICIIQDSREDWNQQSAVMADIYGGAHVTLCATASASDDEGFYAPPLERQRSHEVEVRGPDGRIYKPNVELFKGSHIPGWRSVGEASETEGFPLMTRAWAFQERVLSPRLIHFTRGEVMWECFELSSCQCSNDYEPYSTEPDEGSPYIGDSKRIYKALAKSLIPSPHYPDSAQKFGWEKVARAYSALRLTLEADKLPALSGVAKREQVLRRGDEYLAGLWRSTLQQDMQWVSFGSTRPSKRRYPSWSWTAVDGPRRGYDSGRDVSAILEASITLASSDPTGEVSGGHVLISGRTAVVEYVGRSLLPMEGELRATLRCNGHSQEFLMDCNEDFREGEAGRVQVGDRLTCLQMAQVRGKESTYFALVLRPCGVAGSSSPPVYERVGCISSEMDEETDGIDQCWCLGRQPLTLKVV
jgi:hypothetical protein